MVEHIDKPLTWPNKLRDMACDLYRNARIHKARENKLVLEGLAVRMDDGRAVLKSRVREAMTTMFRGVA